MPATATLPAMSVSRDPETIARWAADALGHRLYLPLGTAQYVFRGDGVIYEMAYLPGIAWVMDHEWPARWASQPRRLSVYTHPDHRRRGICRTLQSMMSRSWQDFH